MVKWPGVRRLEALITARDTQIEILQSEVSHLRTEVAVRGQLNDRLEHELDLLRTDYRNLTDRVINMASRPVSKSLFDDDPFKEVNKPTEFLSPDTPETVDFEALAQTLEEKGGDEASTP